MFDVNPLVAILLCLRSRIPPTNLPPDDLSTDFDPFYGFSALHDTAPLLILSSSFPHPFLTIVAVLVTKFKDIRPV